MREEIRKIIENFVNDHRMVFPEDRERLINEVTDKITAIKVEEVTRTVYRDAKTGRFLTKAEADASPHTSILSRMTRLLLRK